MLRQPTTPHHIRHNNLNREENKSKEKSMNIEHKSDKRKEKGEGKQLMEAPITERGKWKKE